MRIQRSFNLHYFSRVLAVLQSLLVLPLGVSGSAPAQADDDGGWSEAIGRPAAEASSVFVVGRPGSRISGEAFEHVVKAEIEAASTPVQEALILLEIPDEVAAEGPY